MISKMHTKGKGGFTLVEIMIVVAIIALLAAIAVPSFLRARERSQATTVLNELRLIDAAKDQYLIENNLTTITFEAAMLTPYLKPGSGLETALAAATTADEVTGRAGNATIVFGAADELPRAEVEFDEDVVPADTFWSPYSVTFN